MAIDLKIEGTSGDAFFEKLQIIFDSSNIHLNTDTSVFYFILH